MPLLSRGLSIAPPTPRRSRRKSGQPSTTAVVRRASSRQTHYQYEYSFFCRLLLFLACLEPSCLVIIRQVYPLFLLLCFALLGDRLSLIFQRFLATTLHCCALYSVYFLFFLWLCTAVLSPYHISPFLGAFLLPRTPAAVAAPVTNDTTRRFNVSFGSA